MYSGFPRLEVLRAGLESASIDEHRTPEMRATFPSSEIFEADFLASPLIERRPFVARQRRRSEDRIHPKDCSGNGRHPLEKQRFGQLVLFRVLIRVLFRVSF